MIAGKTGTTQLPGGNGEGAKDNWFVGYTPGLVAAVWLGYDHTDAEHFLTTTGKSAAIVFREIMREALSGFPNVPFDGIVLPQKVQRDEEDTRSDDNEDEDENEEDDNEKKQDRKEKRHKEKEHKGKEHKNRHND